MTSQDNSTSSEKTGFEAGRKERQSVYPDDGYALIKISMMKPPGEALTKLAEYDSLDDVSMPPETEFADYVVYDSDGNAYSHDDL
ncbi:hypothetical protein [Natronorubrum tibetense]|uniref:Uncharacterized protein n=1 Tax=Natronorubrum tibetense GA33 TaxID=1114856 RepID=L9VRM5_9EURY|nr:hypothetical protein [Natronorubrum tibetense]ELY39855.1 hypothetical protein C496_14296 [Natronorubrum tibetense GA33]